MNKKTKKGIIIGTIVAGIVGAAFLGGAKIIDIINDGSEGNQSNNTLSALKSVSNISFDEESRLLTFDEVEQASGYEIAMKNVNLDKTYTLETPTGSLQIEVPINTLTGHTLNFSIVSLGDYKTTKNSTPSTYSYTMQHETERKYTNYTNGFFSLIESSLNFAIRGGDIEMNSIDAIDYKNEYFYVMGSAKNYKDLDFNFTISAKAKTIPSNFTSPDIIANMIGSIGSAKTVSSTFTEGMTNVSDGLVLGQSATFKQYIDNGYHIETLQQTNSDFTNLGNGLRSFSVNGIYKAVNQDGEKITFEADHVVTMSENELFTSSKQYFDYFNQTGDATIADNGSTVMNEDLMNHLEIMQEIHQEQQTQKMESALEF